jgi:hypothetical protein
MYRELHQTAMGQARQLGRVGGIGVVVAGALCAAVLFIAGGVLPDPADQGGIPTVVIGDSPGGDALAVVRQGGGAELYRRVAASAPEARGERAGRRRGDARVRGGGHPRLGDGGAAGLVKSRGDGPAPRGRDGRPDGGGPSGPGSGSPSGGQNEAVVPPAAGAQPVHDEPEAPEPAPGPDTDEAPDVAPASAPSAPDDEPSDDPAPAGLAAPAPETDLDEAGAESPGP